MGAVVARGHGYPPVPTECPADGRGDRDGARRAATATLTTLAERLGREGADELALALPGELREPLEGAPATAGAFDADEFVRRTAARAGSSPRPGPRVRPGGPGHPQGGRGRG
jgi:uncharacterized protein (DUF2267 family)